MKKYLVIIFLGILCFNSCKKNQEQKESEIKEKHFDWRAANIYFLLPDRFNNADTSNDVNFGRDKETAVLRGFEGGDLKGITEKIKDGYFSDLGINAIWMAPVFEQIHGGTDEGTGITYGFHGYWTKDWTEIDPNFGTIEDLKELISEAHKKGIRILLDAVINHTGPVTETDTVWPAEWVRTEPPCDFQTYETTIDCTLVKNLPDILTDSDEEVELPPQLVEKWKTEGKYEQEMKELDEFFAMTGFPRAPRFYIMKWLTDYIKKLGIDGYRVDTVKHVEESVWQEFRKACDLAYNEYKKNHSDMVLDENFYLVGELYNYGISSGQYFDFGDKKANYFKDSFNSMINFEFKWNAKELTYEELFAKYDSILYGDLKEYGVLNYLTSHDDGQPFDLKREKTFEAANKLLLAPGAAQLYYGDETARPLEVKGAVGDANLRSNMNWEALNTEEGKKLLEHYQKLGKFRAKHPAVGAGKHLAINYDPYVFVRWYKTNDYEEEVVIGLDMPKGKKQIELPDWEDGTVVTDGYSGATAIVKNETIELDTPYDIVLLERNENN